MTVTTTAVTVGAKAPSINFKAAQCVEEFAGVELLIYAQVSDLEDTLTTPLGREINVEDWLIVLRTGRDGVVPTDEFNKLSALTGSFLAWNLTADTNSLFGDWCDENEIHDIDSLPGVEVVTCGQVRSHAYRHIDDVTAELDCPVGHIIVG